VRSLDHAVGRLCGPRRVVVDVRTGIHLAVIRPVWHRLAADPRVSLVFTSEDTTRIASALTDDHLSHLLQPRVALTWCRFDLAITADMWSHVDLRRCRRWLNFFHGVAGKYDLDDPARLDVGQIGRFDRIAFINQDRFERWLASGVIDHRQATLVGFPKLDPLLNGRWSPHEVRRALGLRPGRTTVLYAPTFSPASSLHMAGEAIVETLLAAGRNVVVKLHDRSLTPHPRYTDGIDWAARFSRFVGTPGFLFSTAADSTPLLAAADVLVTDHSSVGFEFALLDRPLIVFDAPALKESARIAQDKWDLLRSMAEVVGTPAAVAEAVAAAIANPRPRCAERAAARRLFAHPGTATDRALTVVYDLIELPLPVGVTRHDAAPGAETPRHSSTAEMVQV
jgi:hypothetical protein